MKLLVGKLSFFSLILAWLIECDVTYVENGEKDEKSVNDESDNVSKSCKRKRHFDRSKFC
jgi:hypothetical protein